MLWMVKHPTDVSLFASFGQPIATAARSDSGAASTAELCQI
jgi:hypothetical protein